MAGWAGGRLRRRRGDQSRGVRACALPSLRQLQLGDRMGDRRDLAVGQLLPHTSPCQGTRDEGRPVGGRVLGRLRLQRHRHAAAEARRRV